MGHKRFLFILIMIIINVMIVMNVVLAILFNSHCGRWFQKNFRSRFFQLERLVSHFIEVYFPPTQLFREKLLLKKVSCLANKRFAGVSTSFLGIAHKDALICLGFKFVRL